MFKLTVLIQLGKKIVKKHKLEDGYKMIPKALNILRSSGKSIMK